MLLKKFSHILEGFKNYVFENEAVEHIAKERAEICAGCPFIKKYRLYKFIGHYGCSICMCAVSTKTRSPEEECPKGKWKAVRHGSETIQTPSKE